MLRKFVNVIALGFFVVAIPSLALAGDAMVPDCGCPFAHEGGAVTPHARAEIAALLARLGDGDRSAIEPAFHVLWPLVRRFSARALGREADAEDAAQQAIVKIYGQVSGYDRARDGVAWVLCIASYECRTVRRRAQRRREDAIESAKEVASDARSPEALALERELEAAAKEVLGAMREEDAAAVLAAIGDERPADAGFRKRLQRALARLRVAWRTKHGT